MSTLIVAHRGDSGFAPENTLAAVSAAIRQRADYLEVDARLSADGEVVLFHDGTLARTTNASEVYPQRAPWAIEDFTLEELKRLDAGSWFDPAYAGERIPTLAEALDLMAGRIGLWLELKSPRQHPGLEKAVAKVLANADSRWLTAPGWCVATGFESDSVDRFAAEVDRSVPLGQLAKSVPDDRELAAETARVDYYLPDHRNVTVEDITRIRAAGLRAGFWTPNDPISLSTLITAGAASVITNYTELARTIAYGDYRAPASGPMLQRLADHTVLLRNLDAEAVSLLGWRMRGDPADVLWSGTADVPVDLPAHGTLEVALDGQVTPDSIALHRPDGALADVVARLRAPQSC